LHFLRFLPCFFLHFFSAAARWPVAPGPALAGSGWQIAENLTGPVGES
jgi:hypothetical protein